MDKQRSRDRLNEMDEQLSALIAIADELEDHMLAAILLQARDRISTTYQQLRMR